MGAIVFKLLVILVCLVVSFVLSGMEAGVFALSRLRVRQQVRAGKPSAQVLHGFLENPENFLWTILVGNTLANFLILTTGIALLFRWLGDWPGWFAAALAAGVFIFYTLCDLLPKMLFRQFPNRLCLFWAGPFRLMDLALRPFVLLAEGFSQLILHWTGGNAFKGHLFGNREELRLVMQESAAVFSGEERVMIGRVLDLQNLTVQRVELPMASAMTVQKEMPMAEVFDLCREKMVTRLPVWESKNQDRRIIGILDLDELIYRADLPGRKCAGDFVKPALYLDEDLRLEIALQKMQRNGQRLAIVLGRNRRETGIVALEDILKVIFGEVKL